MGLPACTRQNAVGGLLVEKQLIGVDISNDGLHYNWLVGNTSLDFFQAAFNYVQAQFTFVVCRIKRSSHAFCAGAAKLAQSLYCRCASSRAHHQNNQNNGTMSTRILGVIAGNRVGHKMCLNPPTETFIARSFGVKWGLNSFWLDTEA